MAEAFLTTAKAAMAGQLQGSLGAVPAVPGKLVFAFFNTTLGTSCHAAGVDQVSLQGYRSQNSDFSSWTWETFALKWPALLFLLTLPSLQNNNTVSILSLLSHLTLQITL